MTQVTQRGATRNQSTADYQTKHGFIWDNYFQRAVFKNTTGGSFTLKPMSLIIRNTAITGQVKPATYTDIDTNDLADVIGIASHEGDIVLASNALVNITYCTEGGIDANLLQLPAGVTLDTVVGTKTLFDILTGLGLDIDRTTTEMTKFDN